MQTERVTFLTTPDHKAALDAFAASSGRSVGHVVREATSRFIAQGADDSDEEAELAALVAEVNVAIPKMIEALDEMSATLDATHQEIDKTLRAVKKANTSWSRRSIMVPPRRPAQAAARNPMA